MGGEFGQWKEWNHDTSLDWHLLDDPRHAGVQPLGPGPEPAARRGARAPRARLRPARASNGSTATTRTTASCRSSAGARRRQNGSSRSSTSLPCRATAISSASTAARTGTEIGNSDATVYGGSGVGNMGRAVALGVPVHGRSHSLALSLPPLGALFLKPVPAPDKPALEAADEEVALDVTERRGIGGRRGGPHDGIGRWTATSASTATSTSRRARTPGSRRSKRRSRPTRTTTGTSASPPSATRRTPRARILDGENRIVEIVNNYASMSFNFGPTLLSWLEAERARRLRGDPRGRPRERRALRGARLGDRAGVQPRDPAARRTRATSARRSSGASATSSTASAGRRRACGCPRPRSTPPRSKLWRRPGSASRSSRRTRPATLRSAGGDWAGDARPRASIRRARTACRCRPAEPSRSSSTTARSRAPSPSSGAARPRRASRRAPRRAPSTRRAAGRSSSTSPPTARPTATTTATATWRSPTRCGTIAESRALARLTNYGEFLEKHPPDARGRGSSRTTSWSCAHGVERWRSDCGCQTGAHPGWNQAWRAPLREALDWPARRSGAALREGRGGAVPRIPWAARDDYIDVILDRSPESVGRLLVRARPARRSRSPSASAALELLELQRHALLMYTSCGWFFDDIAGIEARQILQYAGRAAAALAEALPGRRSRDAVSGDARRRRRATFPKPATAGASTRTRCGPARVTLPRVGGALRRVAPFSRSMRDSAPRLLLSRRSGGRAPVHERPRAARAGARPGHVDHHRGVRSGRLRRPPSGRPQLLGRRDPAFPARPSTRRS